MPEVYQLQVSLKGSEPKIWRRILVDSNTELFVLHAIIQISAGWRNCHLHQFIKDGKYYSNEDDDDFDDLTIDYEGMTVKDLLKNENDEIIYEYDFGDSWFHVVLLEKILPFDSNLNYPLCVAGEKSFPPEDCGGIYGYYNLLNIMANPKDREHKQMKSWLEDIAYDNFDADHFDKNRVNAMLDGIFN